MQTSLLQEFDMGNVDMDKAEANDLRHVVLTVFWLGAYLTTIITFIMWFRRAYNNLHTVNPEGCEYPENWAAIGWFIPFLNLVRPYQIMREIWDGTFRNAGMETEGSSSIVGLWWGLYIGGNILSNIFSRMGGEDNIGEMITSSRYAGYGALVVLPALVCAIVMINKVEVAEQKMREEMHEPDIMRHLVSDSAV